MIRYLLLLIIPFQFFFFTGELFSEININSKIFQRPFFPGETRNVFHLLTIRVDSSADRAYLREIIIEAGDSPSEKVINSISILNSGGGDAITRKEEFRNRKLIFRLNRELPAGVNIFYLSCTVKEDASLNEPVLLRCKSMTIGDKKHLVDKKFYEFLIGRIVRKPGDDAAKCYRIPGLITTKRGTLIAAYDIRYESCGDLPGNIDVGVSRSTDGGKIWLPMKIVMDMGDPQSGNGIGDPSILLDKQTGTIWIAALWSHGNNGWNGSGRGLTPEETGQLVLVKSEDDGISWSNPINITERLKDPSWKLFFQGPGSGISLRDGTLIFPAQFRDSTGNPFSTIIYSKDHGKNWSRGTGAKSNTTEAQAVELESGEVMLNMRDNRGEFRSVAITSDLGKTWIEHASSRNALREPVCMAGLIRAGSKKAGDKKNILAFSNPDDSKRRKNMTVKLSLDEGMSWNKNHQLLYDERECFGYSSLTTIDDKYLGVLYEGRGELYFVNINLGRILRN